MFSVQFVCSTCCLAWITWYLHPYILASFYSKNDYEWTATGGVSLVEDVQSRWYKESRLDSETTARTFPIIDVLSTGSIHRPDNQVVQEAYLREHPSVRHYFAVTEFNDTEVDCHRHLNLTQLKLISNKCRTWKGKAEAPLLAHMISGYVSMRYLTTKENPTGWMCAQKRPLTALWKILQTYPSNGDDFPDYLFLLDDDTWIQMDTLVPNLILQYPSRQPFLIAGCLVESSHDKFSFPFGGFGTIFTKAAVQRWIQPLTDCNPFSTESSHVVQETTDHDFVRYSCDRYHQHHRIGERIPPSLFSISEMTVADILYSYVQRANYTDVTNWDGIGFCLHSDWALGYFAGEYQVTLDGQLQAYQNSTIGVRGIMTGECQHQKLESCHRNATICHYMTPVAMIQRMKNITPHLQQLLNASIYW